jgi:hypothetical protein
MQFKVSSASGSQSSHTFYEGIVIQKIKLTTIWTQDARSRSEIFKSRRDFSIYAIKALQVELKSNSLYINTSLHAHLK